jgi:hypothetical protein
MKITRLVVLLDWLRVDREMKYPACDLSHCNNNLETP